MLMIYNGVNHIFDVTDNIPTIKIGRRKPRKEYGIRLGYREASFCLFGYFDRKERWWVSAHPLFFGTIAAWREGVAVIEDKFLLIDGLKIPISGGSENRPPLGQYETENFLVVWSYDRLWVAKR
jgi:hypothetical protein